MTNPGFLSQVSGMSDFAVGFTSLFPFLTVRLFQSPVLVSYATVVAQLLEPTFAGYAGLVLANVETPLADPVNGGVSCYLGSALFVCSSAPLAPQMIYGWWIDDGSGNLLAAGNFIEPYRIAKAKDAIFFEIVWNFSDGKISVSANV